MLAYLCAYVIICLLHISPLSVLTTCFATGPPVAREPSRRTETLEQHAFLPVRVGACQPLISMKMVD